MADTEAAGEQARDWLRAHFGIRPRVEHGREESFSEMNDEQLPYGFGTAINDMAQAAASPDPEALRMAARKVEAMWKELRVRNIHLRKVH